MPVYVPVRGSTGPRAGMIKLEVPVKNNKSLNASVGAIALQKKNLEKNLRNFCNTESGNTMTRGSYPVHK